MVIFKRQSLKVQSASQKRGGEIKEGGRAKIIIEMFSQTNGNLFNRYDITQLRARPEVPKCCLRRLNSMDYDVKIQLTNQRGSGQKLGWHQKLWGCHLPYEGELLMYCDQHVRQIEICVWDGWKSDDLWAASGQLFLWSLMETEDSRLGDSFSFGWDQGWPFLVVVWQLLFSIQMEPHQTESIRLWCLWKLEEGDHCFRSVVMLGVGQLRRFSVDF